LGFSKAAIYYHFESKEAILMALHLRLGNALGLDALRNIDRETDGRSKSGRPCWII